MKSKEALERLKFIADKELNTGSKSYEDLQEFWNYKEPLKVITDLVERDTPMKVNHNDFDTYCVKCGNHLFKKPQVYCDECGQRLDWS